MKFKLKPYIIVLIIVAVLAVAIIVYSNYKKNRTPEEVPNDTPADARVSWKNDSFPLGIGSSGTRVKYLQAALNIAFDSHLATDGKFGNKTLAVLKDKAGYDTVSEQGYRELIDSRMDLIKKYFAKLAGAPAEKHAASSTGLSEIPSFQNGQSVKAKTATQGYKGEKSILGNYSITSDLYGNFRIGEYIGVIVAIQEDWLIVITASGERVYVLKENCSL